MNLDDHLLRMREAKSVVSFLFCFYLLEGEKGGGSADGKPARDRTRILTDTARKGSRKEVLV